ncbi:hypothetical protein [Marinobacter sp. HL-58]|uniref:hypothetical protein n=1 Tax=Marinobacter sp. HL-58 TaxID=1479237 RepID=UPI0006912E60|nr:hypothetical protein [Marinobacter sp. HL-58]KPQ01931.1 MAG: hypothetical protein HLUCCO03_06260 [Marinobacter sp. HL-58]
MGITEKKRFQQIRRNWNSRLRALRIDGKNRKQYGDMAPKFAELLWVPTDSIDYSVKVGSSKDSARVVQDWPDQLVVPVRELPSIKACLAHWQDGVAWEETGIFQQMLKKIDEKGKVDRLRNLDDIKSRYQSVDELYRQVALSRRLSPRSELIPGNFREEGGILIHIGPSGTPFFGKKGHHRLAIALALKLEYVPVQLGVVHISAIKSLEAFRLENPQFL